MFWRKRRYIVVLLSFLGYVSSYTLRVNLSVAIVAMTQNRTVVHDNGTVDYVRDPAGGAAASKVHSIC